MSDENGLQGGSETILIVDDHETIWDFLIDVLQKLGYCVLLAENGLDDHVYAEDRSSAKSYQPTQRIDDNGGKRLQGKGCFGYRR